jgi:exopolysaccharide production protein ExoY
MQQVDPVQFPESHSNAVIHDPLITITNQGYFYNDRSTHAKALGGQGKRYFDFAITLIALLVLLPLLCFIAIAILAVDRRPILYRHPRIGWNGVLFDCLKFRTMVVNADEVLQRHLAANPAAAREWKEKQKLTVDPRLTRIGNVLRKSSLDELPQLFNILKGEMSLVGPRPIVMSEIPRYGDCILFYLRARPGLTGLWQVSGRNRLDYSRKVALDREYVENWCFWRDLIIIMRTFRAVVSAHGCY